MGILYIASYLESKGITTEVLDLNVDNNKKINFKKFDYIGFSVNAGNIENTIESVKKVKQKSPKSKIILGGPHIKIVHKKLLELPQIECLIADEAEDIMYKYIISKNKFKVKGIYIRKKGKSVQSAQAMDGNLIDGIPLCGKILFAIKNGGLWRSWERVSMALRRSWVRVPLGPLDL